MFDENQSVYVISHFFREHVSNVAKGYVLIAQHPRYFVNVYPDYSSWYNFYELIECY
jgi:hypothetical protein